MTVNVWQYYTSEGVFEREVMSTSGAYNYKDFNRWRAQLMIKFVADATTRAWAVWQGKDCTKPYRAAAAEALLLVQAVARREPLANLKDRAEGIKMRLRHALHKDPNMQYSGIRTDSPFSPAIDTLLAALDVACAEAKSLWQLRQLQGTTTIVANTAIEAGASEVDIADAYLTLNLKACHKKAERKHIAAAAVCWIAGEQDVAKRLLKDGRVR